VIIVFMITELAINARIILSFIVLLVKFV
jgi:hypothetical protein